MIRGRLYLARSMMRPLSGQRQPPGVQSSMGGPLTKDYSASDSKKVALSLRDRKRDQQGGVDLPSHLGSTANATRMFSPPVAERQGYHQLATAPSPLLFANGLTPKKSGG